MLTMLEDPSGAVTRQVAVSLRPHASSVSVDALTPLLAPDAPPHVRSAGYRVLREHDVWTRLLTDLSSTATRTSTCAIGRAATYPDGSLATRQRPTRCRRPPRLPSSTRRSFALPARSARTASGFFGSTSD